MSTRVQELRQLLRSVQSAESEADLKELDETVSAIFQEGLATQCFPELFQVFERFPDKDGFGVFWSILHGLEAVPGYQPFLLDSVERAPSEFTVRMINRMLNAGELQIGSSELLSALEHIAARMDIPPAVRDEAARFVSHQQRKRGKPGGAAHPSQPDRSETNRSPAAVGSGR